MIKTFDFIIIGHGLAARMLARRLNKNLRASVCHLGWPAQRLTSAQETEPRTQEISLLHGEPDVQIDHLLLADRRVYGVQTRAGWQAGHRAKQFLVAHQQVILCAGAINNAQLLHASGIEARMDWQPLERTSSMPLRAQHSAKDLFGLQCLGLADAFEMPARYANHPDARSIAAAYLASATLDRTQELINQPANFLSPIGHQTNRAAREQLLN